MFESKIALIPMCNIIHKLAKEIQTSWNHANNLQYPVPCLLLQAGQYFRLSHKNMDEQVLGLVLYIFIDEAVSFTCVAIEREKYDAIVG